jgi:thioredoxin-dependent peroxiredoxin
VLYFYPKDFTSGCTREAHDFQRDLPQYERKNAIILGVSGQDETSHQRFCAKESLGFRLLADTDFEASSVYGSLVNLGVAKLSARHTFLIDPAGVVRKAYLNVNAEKHSAEVLADLAQLQQPPG